jgi:hypothetical protein
MKKNATLPAKNKTLFAGKVNHSKVNASVATASKSNKKNENPIITPIKKWDPTRFYYY